LQNYGAINFVLFFGPPCIYKNFFQNILLKTAWLCDAQLQNYGAINFVLFFGPPCIYKQTASH